MFKKVLLSERNTDTLIGLYAGFVVAIVFITEKTIHAAIIGLALGFVILCLSFKSNNRIFTVRFFVCLLLLIAWLSFYIWFSFSNVPKIVLKDSDISIIKGTMIKDSSYTRDERSMYYVKLNSIENKQKGIKASAEGIVGISMPHTAIKLRYGEQAVFYINNYKNGTYRGYRLKRIKEPCFFIRLRSVLYDDILDRIMVLYKTDNSESAYYARNLASMLLLSSSSVEENIKKDASLLGLAHIFALSGAHLMLIAAAVKGILKLFLPPQAVSVFNTFILGIYVFIVGPLPSLIRAFIMFTLLDNFKELRPYALFITVILQTLFFPYTITSIAFKLSYVCVWALFTFNSIIAYSISYSSLRLFSPIIAASVTAVLFSSPISIRNFGYWSPLGIVLSPLVMLLCVFCMAGGVLNVFFCPSAIGAFLMKYSYIGIRFILDLFIKKAPDFSWGAYALLIVFSLMLFALKLLLSNRIIGNRH